MYPHTRWSDSELSNQLFVETLPPIVESTKSAPTEGSARAGVIAALSGNKPNYNQALTELDKLPSEVQTNFPDYQQALKNLSAKPTKFKQQAENLLKEQKSN